MLIKIKINIHIFYEYYNTVNGVINGAAIGMCVTERA
jgi:hypothetical protein